MYNLIFYNLIVLNLIKLQLNVIFWENLKNLFSDF
jgi:hypothetical protein